MSYLELNSVIFRGELNGASGEVDFSLSANSLMAIDDIHVRGDAIVYSKTGSATGSASSGQTIFSMDVEAKNPSVCMSIDIYCSRSFSVTLAGGSIQANSNGLSAGEVSRFYRLVTINQGVYPLVVKLTSSGAFSMWCTVRYYRNTGAQV